MEDIHPFYDFHDPDHYVVYTMGKVGSTALCRSLEAVGLKATHCQWLNPETFKVLCWDEIILRNNDSKAKFFIDNKRHYRNCSYYFGMQYPKNKIKIITGCRDPIDNFLSYYFHSNFQHAVKKKHGTLNAELVIDDIVNRLSFAYRYRNQSLADMANQRDEFQEEELLFWYMATNSLWWFDEEFRHNTGINYCLYDMPTCGWKALNDRILLLKFEKFGQDMDKAIANFVSRPNYCMLRANSAEERADAALYKEVKHSIVFPKFWLDYAYTSRYVTTFYSTDEISNFYSRWGQRSSITDVPSIV